MRNYSVYAGEFIDVVEDSVDRVYELLGDMERGTVYKAVGSAMIRSLAAGRTVAKKAAMKEYTVSQSDFLSNIRNINSTPRNSYGDVQEIVAGFRSPLIPLVRFDTKSEPNGGIIAHVKRNNTPELLGSAFFAQVGAHYGIYEREGEARFPIKQLFGPAPTQMMYANEDVLDAVESKMVETYNKRIEHEITRILNGYGT